MAVSSCSLTSSPVQRELQDEDLRALRLRRPEPGAQRRLPRPARALPHPGHLLRQRHGGLLDAARTPQLQGAPVLPASRRVQEAQRVGEQQPDHRLSETRHRDQLILLLFAPRCWAPHPLVPLKPAVSQCGHSTVVSKPEVSHSTDGGVSRASDVGFWFLLGGSALLDKVPPRLTVHSVDFFFFFLLWSFLSKMVCLAGPRPPVLLESQ